MRTLGKMTTAVMVAGLGLGLSLAWRSRSDIQRYLKMRSM
jgi:hypothetical protein